MDCLKKLGSLLLLIAALFSTLHLNPCTAANYMPNDDGEVEDIWAGEDKEEWEPWGNGPETKREKEERANQVLQNFMYNAKRKHENNIQRQQELDKIQGTQIAESLPAFDPAKYTGLSVQAREQEYQKASDQTKILTQQIAEATRVRQLPIQQLQLQPIKPPVQAQVQKLGHSPIQSAPVELDERGAKPQSQRNAKLAPPVESDERGAKPQSQRNAKPTLIENEQTSKGGPPRPQVVETHNGVSRSGNINTHLAPIQEGDVGVGGARLGTFSPPFGPITIQPIQSPPVRKFGHTHNHQGHTASGTGAGSGQYGAGRFHSSSGFKQKDPPSDVRFHRRRGAGYSSANAMHGRCKLWNLNIKQLIGLHCLLLPLLV